MIKPVAIKGKPSTTYKGCADCFYCRGAVGKWCVNMDAIRHRGTRSTDAKDCRFWKSYRRVSDMAWLEYFGYLVFGLLTTITVGCTNIKSVDKLEPANFDEEFLRELKIKSY